MPEPAIIITVVGLAIMIGSILYSNNSQESGSNDYWYDFWNDYLEYTEAHNDELDNYIMCKCDVSNKLIQDHKKAVPNTGKYKIEFYNDKKNYLGFVGIIKSVKKFNDRQTFKYLIYSRKKELLTRFQNEFSKFQMVEDEVEIMSIDTSTDKPTIIKSKKICKTIYPRQLDIIKYITSHFSKKNDFNTKVIIYGTRGLGKTYVAKLLKKYIEETTQGQKIPLLFDDFNPSTIAANINTLILQKAEETTPVILVINEIDTAYDKVNKGVEIFDHRLQHTRNKQCFHDMLDIIGNKKHVITIYTSERDPVEMYKSNDYASFMRKGRVDFFVKMTENQSIAFNHDGKQILNLDI